jgi:hypothetical protein
LEKELHLQTDCMSLVLVQRKKPDGSVRLSYCGGELLALMFADISSGFQL